MESKSFYQFEGVSFKWTAGIYLKWIHGVSFKWTRGGNGGWIFQLTDDFAQSPGYDLLYTELTGAVALYLEEYGI